MKYSKKCADLRTKWCARSRDSAEIDGKSHWISGTIIRLVWSEEKVSEEKVKMIDAHSRAGHQARSKRTIGEVRGARGVASGELVWRVGDGLAGRIGR